MDNKTKFANLIRSNIEKYGFHLTIVQSKIEPRYAYTIGLKDQFNFELIFAGGIIFLENDLYKIFGEIASKINNEANITKQNIEVESLGFFSFANVSPSWTKIIMLGVFDYYQQTNVNAFQIIPDKNHLTLDIPNMSNEWNGALEPVWQWLVRKWDYSVSEDSTVVTNLDALKGEDITEIMRTENDEWEMFAGAGPEVDEEDLRVVSLGMILCIDKSVLPALNLEIGKGLWRNSIGSDWNEWG